jgi:two-component system sensor histidine kinase RegB
VARCRGILDQMSAHAGEIAGEALAPVTLAELTTAAIAELTGAERAPVRVELVGDAADATHAPRYRLPPRALAQAVRVLVANAQDASPAGAEVLVRADADAAGLRIEVRDRGAGMSADVLARVGEPFYTTKPPGQGMGLGLFLARSVIERLGGELRLDSAPGRGTTAIVRVPVTPATRGRMAAAPAPVLS